MNRLEEKENLGKLVTAVFVAALTSDTRTKMKNQFEFFDSAQQKTTKKKMIIYSVGCQSSNKVTSFYLTDITSTT